MVSCKMPPDSILRKHFSCPGYEDDVSDDDEDDDDGDEDEGDHRGPDDDDGEVDDDDNDDVDDDGDHVASIVSLCCLALFF